VMTYSLSIFVFSIYVSVHREIKFHGV
jgi:hypothetical protein